MSWSSFFHLLTNAVLMPSFVLLKDATRNLRLGSSSCWLNSNCLNLRETQENRVFKHEKLQRRGKNTCLVDISTVFNFNLSNAKFIHWPNTDMPANDRKQRKEGQTRRIPTGSYTFSDWLHSFGSIAVLETMKKLCMLFWKKWRRHFWARQHFFLRQIPGHLFETTKFEFKTFGIQLNAFFLLRGLSFILIKLIHLTYLNSVSWRKKEEWRLFSRRKRITDRKSV